MISVRARIAGRSILFLQHRHVEAAADFHPLPPVERDRRVIAGEDVQEGNFAARRQSGGRRRRAASARSRGRDGMDARRRRSSRCSRAGFIRSPAIATSWPSTRMPRKVPSSWVRALNGPGLVSAVSSIIAGTSSTPRVTMSTPLAGVSTGVPIICSPVSASTTLNPAGTLHGFRREQHGDVRAATSARQALRNFRPTDPRMSANGVISVG